MLLRFRRLIAPSLTSSTSRVVARDRSFRTLRFSFFSLAFAVACGDPEAQQRPASSASTPGSAPSTSGTIGPGRPSSSATGSSTSAPPTGEPTDGPGPVNPPSAGNGTENLFVSLLGKSQAEVDSKLEQAVNRFFGIGTQESSTPTVNTGYRCYYELPQDSSQAFIWAADSNDVRSEGMSYGMFIAVQMDLQSQFDNLWRFSQEHMQYSEGSNVPAWEHYFRWQGTVNTSNASSWSVNFGGNTTPAPDGDEYFAAALYLADQRWGSSGDIDYKQEADQISAALLHNSPSNDGRYPIFHTSEKLIVFVPYGDSYSFTDPSYHLPAFYELFALYGPANDADEWREIADKSRDFLVLSAHSSTGLYPDYATFSGQPRTGTPGDEHDQFRYDAWRVPLNMAVDYAWFGQDSRMQAQTEKLHEFFSSRLSGNNVANSLFHVDGSNASGGGSTALTATLGAGALASDHADRETFVNNLWLVEQQSGQYRYYQESVYLLGLLAAGGRFNFAW